MHSRTLGLFIVFLFFGIAASAQCPVMPSGFLCISQAAGNAAAENARLIPALEGKIAVLEQGLRDKDVTITETREAGRKNVEDLTGRLMTVTAEAAHEKGQRVQLEADKVFWTEIIKLAIQNARKKCAGVSLIC